jgi:hypothetical protein
MTIESGASGKIDVISLEGDQEEESEESKRLKGERLISSVTELEGQNEEEREMGEIDLIPQLIEGFAKRYLDIPQFLSCIDKLDAERRSILLTSAIVKAVKQNNDAIIAKELNTYEKDSVIKDSNRFDMAATLAEKGNYEEAGRIIETIESNLSKDAATILVKQIKEKAANRN